MLFEILILFFKVNLLENLNVKVFIKIEIEIQDIIAALKETKLKERVSLN